MAAEDGYVIEISKASADDSTTPDGSGWMTIPECQDDHFRFYEDAEVRLFALRDEVAGTGERSVFRISGPRGPVRA